MPNEVVLTSFLVKLSPFLSFVPRNAQYGSHDWFTDCTTYAPPASSSWSAGCGHVASAGVISDPSCASDSQWSPFNDATHIRIFTHT